MTAQIIANALVSGGLCFLLASGFTLAYATSRFFNLSYVISFTAGAYLCQFFAVQLKLPLYEAVSASLALTAALACTLEAGIFWPLNKRGASPIVLLLASIGIYIVLQNGISLCFGNETRVVLAPDLKRVVPIFGASMTTIQIGVIFTAVITFVTLLVITKITSFGRAMRAVATDRELARAIGIHTQGTVLLTGLVGAVVCGLAGILASINVDMTPTMGLGATMAGGVAAIAGGVGRLHGAFVAALLIGFAQQLTAWTIGLEWQESATLAVLLCFLILRRQGLFGEQLRKATV